MLSDHALLRCQQRGINPGLLGDILDLADVEHPVGGNCRLLRVSRRRARELNRDDRLGRYGVILSDRSGQIVTVFPIEDGHRGARYRRNH